MLLRLVVQLHLLRCLTAISQSLRTSQSRLDRHIFLIPEDRDDRAIVRLLFPKQSVLLFALDQIIVRI